MQTVPFFPTLSDVREIIKANPPCLAEVRIQFERPEMFEALFICSELMGHFFLNFKACLICEVKPQQEIFCYTCVANIVGGASLTELNRCQFFMLL